MAHVNHVQGCSDPSGPHVGVCRDKRDRPRIVLPDGKTVRSYTRASGYGKVLDDLNTLMGWKCRMTVIGALERPDLLEEAGRVREDKFKLNKVVDDLLEAGGATAQATRGTAVHALSEFLDYGLDVGAIPEDQLKDINAYMFETIRLGVKNVLIEAFTVLDDLKVAGTFDRVVEIDGKLYIADLKTSSSANYPHSWAIQMALYSRSQLYDPDTHERTPLPPVDQDRAVLIHLPAGQGRCDLYWIDIAAGWEMATTAVPMLKTWRARKDLLTELES